MNATQWIKANCGQVIRTTVLTLSMAAIATSALAQTNNYLRGPDPTVASLEASTGPYAVANETIPKQLNYGGGVVYYPSKTTEGPFGVVAFSPGFVNTQYANRWWGPELASHGFVVIMINTLTPFDLPGLRGVQLQAALKDVIARSQTNNVGYSGLIDPERRAVMGHSMGGGGSLSAAAKDNTLKAAIPLAPWSANNDWSKVSTPTLIIAGQNDTVAPPSTMATTFYSTLPASLDKAYMEMKAADHFFPNNIGPDAMKPILQKYAVSWLKRFVDNDMRYSPFLCGAPHAADLNSSNSLISAYKETCPY